jgi:polyhydroxybutyrate depolymerase
VELPRASSGGKPDPGAGAGGGSASASGGGSGGSAPAGSGGAGAGGAAAAVDCEGLSGDTGDFEQTVMSGGEAREYLVHVPPGYSPSKAAMVVLDFHGYLESNDDIVKISKMNAVSDAHGFIAVYPQGKSTSWNAGKCCGSSATTKVPDVEFVGAMLDALEASYCVDKKRVYSAGFSNGGMLSHRLACELSDRIAAIGPVAGTMAIDACSPSRPVPVIHFHGTSDFVVPYNGGGLAGADSVEDTIAGWVQRNGCTGQPVNVYKNGDTTCDEHQGCAGGSAVRLCSVDGGGHQWPGGESAGPGGKVSMDVSASEEMVAFFLAHPMK